MPRAQAQEMDASQLGGPDAPQGACSGKSHGAGVTASDGLAAWPGLAASPRPLVRSLQAASVSMASMSLLRANGCPGEPRFPFPIPTAARTRLPAHPGQPPEAGETEHGHQGAGPAREAGASGTRWSRRVGTTHRARSPASSSSRVVSGFACESIATSPHLLFSEPLRGKMGILSG